MFNQQLFLIAIMKNFFENIFQPYIFPFIMLIVGIYLRAGENLNSVTSFFGDNTSSFIKFFNNQLYLWEILFYLILTFILVKLFGFFFKKETKKQKAMLKAIKKTSTQLPVIGHKDEKYLFKYDLDVEDEQYQVNNLRPYCQNCSDIALLMTKKNHGLYYRCNCRKEIKHDLIEDVKSQIITNLEENEQ